MLPNVSPTLATTSVAVVGALVIISTILKLKYWFTRRPMMSGGKNPGEERPPINSVLENPQAIEYDLKDLVIPAVTGWRFKILIWLSYTPFGINFVVPKILSRSNFDRMGSIFIPERPTFYPTPSTPPGGEDHAQRNKELIERLVGNEVKEKGEGFRFPTIADFIRAYRSGLCTPSDVAEAILTAIEDSNKMSPPLRAIVQTNREVVLAMAEASTQRWKEGKTLSVMDGIPVAIKGGFRVEPYEFLGGACFIPNIGKGVPEATMVQKLKQAGAVVIGVANLQEFGTGVLGSNPNHLHLTARNPYNPHHYPGGSSSGSAVCVAAGLCPVALGTDGGGSVRIPAATCGVVGLKITNQGVDGTGYMPLTHTVGAHGPLTSSVLDAAITLDIISRETDGDRKLASLQGVGETRLEGLNVGVYWDYFQHADREIVDKCKAAVSKLQSLGANIVEIKIPELEDSRVAHALTIISEFSNSLAKNADTNFHKITLETHLILLGSTRFKAIDYLNAQKQRTRAIEAMKYFFNELKVDVIVTPAAACPAPVIKPAALSVGIADGQLSSLLMRFAFLANLTGVPGLVLPVGYTGAGLPISLQLMGAWHQENVLLRVGRALEKSGAFPALKPKVFYDVIQTATQA